MQKVGSVVCFFLTVCLSCSQKVEESKIVNISFSNEWKTDSLGCLGLRYKIIDKYLDSIQSFTGFHFSEFKKSFGNPYITKKVGINKRNYYWISCSKAPKVKGDSNIDLEIKRINSEAMQLIVSINNKDIIESIDIVVP